MSQGTLHQKVLECVDRGMATLGESARQAIYWRMENSQHLKHEEIPRKPEQFIKALEEMFGLGARTLERTIVGEMKREFKLSHDVASFEKAVKEAAKSFRAE
jgi:hypothetical protein